MSSELRNAVAVWSDPSPPNDFCHYDHCSAKVPFGTMRIEWKSWKDYPNYCLYFDAGETFIGSFDSLDRAKEHAAAVIEADREAVRAEVVGEIVALLDERISVYEQKRDKADPLADETYNRHEAITYVLEALEIVKLGMANFGGRNAG